MLKSRYFENVQKVWVSKKFGSNCEICGSKSNLKEVFLPAKYGGSYEDRKTKVFYCSHCKEYFVNLSIKHEVERDLYPHSFNFSNLSISLKTKMQQQRKPTSHNSRVQFKTEYIYDIRSGFIIGHKKIEEWR